MPTEIKIQCECGHAKLISKSNISAHRKSKIHTKNMSAIGNNPQTELENTIICSEVVIKNKPEKIVKSKCIDCNIRQISKDSIRSRKQKCNKCWYKYTNEKYSPKNNDEEEEEEAKPVEEVIKTIEEEAKPVEEVVETIEEEAKPVEEVVETIEEEAKPVEEVVEIIEEVNPVVSCDILEFLQRIETHLKKIDDFNTSITSQLIDCDILDIVKSIDKRLQKIEELQAVPNENYFDDKDIDPVYRYTVWMQKQYFTNRVIDEIKRRKHPIFKGIDEDEEEEETTTIIENQRDEEIFENEIIRDEKEVKTTIEETQHDEEVAIKIKHKIIPDSEWLEYIPDSEFTALWILDYLDYIKDNLKIYRQNIALCNVRILYVADSIQIRILTSEDITANYPMLIKRGYLEDCFRVEMDDCIAYKADFLKAIKYKNFSRKGGFHHKITDDKWGHPFFQLEKEILEYARLTNCEAIDTQKQNFKPRLINPRTEIDIVKPVEEVIQTVEVIKPKKKSNFMNLLPTEIINLIYEFARDDTNKKNFLNSYIQCFRITEHLNLKMADILEYKPNEDGTIQFFHKNRDHTKYPNTQIITNFLLPRTLFQLFNNAPIKRFIEFTNYKTDIDKIQTYIKSFEYVFNSVIDVKVFIDLSYNTVELQGFIKTKKGTPTKRVVRIYSQCYIYWTHTKSSILAPIREIFDEPALQLKQLQDEFKFTKFLRYKTDTDILRTE